MNSLLACDISYSVDNSLQSVDYSPVDHFITALDSEIALFQNQQHFKESSYIDSFQLLPAFDDSNDENMQTNGDKGSTPGGKLVDSFDQLLPEKEVLSFELSDHDHFNSQVLDDFETALCREKLDLNTVSSDFKDTSAFHGKRELTDDETLNCQQWLHLEGCESTLGMEEDFGVVSPILPETELHGHFSQTASLKDTRFFEELHETLLGQASADHDRENNASQQLSPSLASYHKRDNTITFHDFGGIIDVAENKRGQITSSQHSKHEIVSPPPELVDDGTRGVESTKRDVTPVQNNLGATPTFSVQGCGDYPAPLTPEYEPVTNGRRYKYRFKHDIGNLDITPRTAGKKRDHPDPLWSDHQKDVETRVRRSLQSKFQSASKKKKFGVVYCQQLDCPAAGKPFKNSEEIRQHLRAYHPELLYGQK